MKLSNSTDDKDNIIEAILKYFDKDFIEETAMQTNFIERKGKLSGLTFFFYVYFL